MMKHLITLPQLSTEMTYRDGKQCERCGEGTYEIADLNDEIHGERHCNKCGHFVNRYEKTEELK